MKEIAVKSAAHLSEVQKKKIEAAIRAKEGADVSVYYEVEPELIGGITIFDGERETDGSVAKKLNAVKEVLKG